MIFLRSIKISRWPASSEHPIISDTINSDAITNDLRTTGNDLSWWLINSDEDVNKWFDLIAITLYSKYKSFSELSLTLVGVEQKDIVTIQSVKLKKSKSPNCIVNEAIDKHYNINVPDYKTLGFLALEIAKVTANNPKHVKMYQINDLDTLLCEYIKKNKDKIKKNQLSDFILERLLKEYQISI